jgi:predicted DNA-binding helix-hairpin-helix protein
VASRRFSHLGFYELKKIGVVMKKARYFVVCRELPTLTVNELKPQGVRQLLARPADLRRTADERQLTLNFAPE